MKKTLLYSTLFAFTFLHAQEKVEFIDYDEMSIKLGEFTQKEEYDNIINYLDKINKNDSIYESSLVTKSYYLLQQKKYEEVIEATNEGLKIRNGKNRYSFIVNKGIALLQSKQLQEALDLYTNAVKDYPKNNVLFHNIGVVQQELGNREEAAKNYIQSIYLDPFYEKSHLQLGKICFVEGKISQALMAFDMYLLLNPDGADSFSVLNSLNVSVSKSSDLEPMGVTISEDDDAFEEIDLVINSRMALSSNYTIDNKINVGLTRQNHALFEQLDDFEGNSGFWDKKYVPFYKWVFENGHFDAFTYTISYSIKNESFKKIVDKKVPEIKEFINLFYAKWLEIMEKNNTQTFEGKTQELTHVFNDYELQAVGLSKGSNKIGNWNMYNTKGQLNGIGKFDEEGRRDGEWKWYNDFGQVTDIETYKNGKLQGKYAAFHDNGNPKIASNYENGELEGEYKFYNYSGALIEKKQFTKGKLNGKYKSYHSIGESAIEYDVNYKNDLLDGTLVLYHVNGEIAKKVNYTEGKLSGSGEEYFNTGQKKETYQYQEGLLDGPYTTYYPNGNVSETGNVKEGYYVGDWKSFYPDNTVKLEFAYDEKGQLDGLYKEYDVDGKLHYEFVYRNGEFIEYRYFNKNGDVVYENKKKKGEFYYKGYSPLGDLLTEGLYDVKGGKKGEWKYYEEGTLTSKVNYENDQVQGDYYDYYRSGKEQSIATYRNDSLIGYYQEFHKNGNLSRQGWNKKGRAQGEWISYYPNGQIKDDNYYHRGQSHGLQKSYSPEGKLYQEMLFDNGELLSETYYNTDGSVLQEIPYDRKKEKHTLIIKHPNGKVNSSAEYLYEVKQGDYVAYDPDGTKVVEGKFLNGKPHGVWTWYHDNTQISTQGNYFYGEYTGDWKYYHKNGKLEREYTYENGQRQGEYKYYSEEGVVSQIAVYKNDNLHGARKFYSPEGKLKLVRYYHNNMIIGYSYNDANGKLKPMIPLDDFSGTIEAFYDNGNPSATMEFKNGYFVNEYVSYYYSGEKEKVTQHKDGDYHGTMISYYKDGSVKEERNYQHDELHGIVKKYYANGNLKEEQHYQFGKQTGKAKYFNEKGELTKEKEFFNDVQMK